MIHNFDQLIQEAQQISKSQSRPVRVVVAAGHDKAALKAMYEAKKLEIADGLLVGNREEIAKSMEELEIDPGEFGIIDVKGEQEICRETVKQIHEGNAELILKGKAKTATLLKNILDSENGLRTGRLISDVFVFEWPERDDENKIIILSDGGFNLAPDLNQKIQILENAVKVAHALGNDNPKVAVLSAVETVNTSLQSTMDAAILSKMNERGQISGCVVDGPLALDNAISLEAAQQKGIQSEVAGRADVLIFPNIESANIAAKGTTYFANLRLAHATMGAKAPVLIPSRSDTADAKLLTLALNVVMSHSGVMHLKN